MAQNLRDRLNDRSADDRARIDSLLAQPAVPFVILGIILAVVGVALWGTFA